jgi:hypothetical protein
VLFRSPQNPKTPQLRNINFKNTQNNKKIFKNVKPRKSFRSTVPEPECTSRCSIPTES